MAKNIAKVSEIDVAAVAGNMTLAAGIGRSDVERCKAAIEKLGVIHTPVVGTTQGGGRVLLSGQCELTALRELGVRKMDAIEVCVTNDAGVMAKLSLLLISLKDKPGALCEGLLLKEAVGAGVPRLEIQCMLGKSASWVSNRISLVTRLDANVYEMVKGGLLDPRSAEEVSRLPAESQFAFAEAAVREGLAKSAIEALVGCYNDESCPGAVKSQILSDPRSALRRAADRRRAANADSRGRRKGKVPPHDVDGCIKTLRGHIAKLCHMLPYVPPHEVAGYGVVLDDLEAELLALLAAVRKFFYPGKMGVENNDG
jgi:ParB-like chromosome segregation protein Spo0J